MLRYISVLVLLCIVSSTFGISSLPSSVASSTNIKHRRKSVHSVSYKRTSYTCTPKEISPVSTSVSIIEANRGGGGSNSEVVTNKSPSIYWAVLHNWLYFMSLGFNLINIQFLVREIVDGDAKAIPSATSIALSGKVESIDKLLTFIGIGFLSALSDKYGRKPLM